jgi:hypothetical protein
MQGTSSHERELLLCFIPIRINLIVIFIFKSKFAREQPKVKKIPCKVTTAFRISANF